MIILKLIFGLIPFQSFFTHCSLETIIFLMKQIFINECENMMLIRIVIATFAYCIVYSSHHIRQPRVANAEKVNRKSNALCVKVSPVQSGYGLNLCVYKVASVTKVRDGFLYV